ncbi:MAG: argininosuccinate synthase domain-containing protein [Thalassobaculum sp.]
MSSRPGRRPSSWASRRSTSRICARSSCATSCSRCSAPTRVYEGTYLLGTSIARPLIAKRQIEIAHETGADAVAHGATGKGNDQVRFELGYYALKPDIKVIAPWREWNLTSRTKLIDFAEKHQIPVAEGQARRGAVLGRRQPAAHLLRGQGRWRIRADRGRATTSMSRTVSPEEAPDTADLSSRSASRRATRSPSTARRCRPATLLTKLNELGRANGIGRLDLVENRFVGMKIARRLRDARAAPSC